MKKIIMLLMAAACMSVAHAQVVLTPAIDTLGTNDTSKLVVRVPGRFDVLTFQVNYTKISGTPSASMILQGSLDGVNYVAVPGKDTAFVTNVAAVQPFIWVLDKSAYLYYRIYGISAGTQSGQIKSLLLTR